MAQITAEGLARIQELLRQVRTIPQLREKTRGTYELLGRTFLQFKEDDGRPYGELAKPSGSGVERFAVDTSPEQRKLVDEAKRRAARMLDE